jgi:two-component system, cell cycle response regulator DivK
VTGATILVVEDNDRNLKLVRDVLEFAGFHVVVATSGEAGVDLAVEQPPDLVLLDLGLPGIDGHEALRRLRASPRTRSLPVVAVTAYAMAADRARALAAGFDGYLDKPLDVRSLPTDVRRFLAAEGAGRG